MRAASTKRQLNGLEFSCGSDRQSYTSILCGHTHIELIYLFVFNYLLIYSLINYLFIYLFSNRR